MSKTVKFGPIGRDAVPYIFNFQNVVLEKNSDHSAVSLNCTVNPEGLVIPSHFKVSVFKGGGENDIYINFESFVNKLSFTCSIDNDTYIQTYKVNEEVLFQCKYDPKNLVISYEGMKETTSQWSFVDH